MLICEQKQKYKVKTIDDLAPMWSEYFDLKTHNHHTQAKRLLNELGMDIQCDSKCVVGEVYGFGWSHIDEDRLNNCNTCRKFALGSVLGHNGLGFLELEHKIQYDLIGTNWRDDPTVTGFLEHWNTDHVNSS